MSTEEFVHVIKTKGCASPADIRDIHDGFHTAASVGAARRVIMKCRKCGVTKCRVRTEVTNMGL